MKTNKTWQALMLSLCVGTIAYAGQSEPQANLLKDDLNTPAQLDAVTKKHKKVVLFLYDRTCPVCGAFRSKGIYPQTAAQLPDVTFATAEKVTGAQLHSKFQVKRYPTFVFFKDGKQLHNVPSFKDPKVKTDRYEGYKENPMFTHMVQQVLAD